MSLAPPDLIRFAYLSLKGNPVRSLLSTIGVFMGVLAVSATLEARNLGQAYLAKQLSQQDAPQVFLYSIYPSNGQDRIRLRPSDLTLLQQQLSGWQSISGQRWVRWNDSILFEDQKAPGTLIGVSSNHLETTGRQLVAGRFFTPTDVEKYRSVVVIDTWLENELFGGKSAIGQQIHVANNAYQVIGVVNALNNNQEDPRGDVIISLSMTTAIRGQDILSRINIRPQNIDELETIGEQAIQILQREHPGQEYRQRNNVDEINEQRQTLRTVSWILLGLGGIALIVGGVGIANITIASTMERVAEIGLRKAVGATQQEILSQFILEAVIISTTGGMLAIATTQTIAFGVAKTFDLPHSMNASTSLMALGSAVFVGVGASFLPAIQASRLDPVHALRG